MIKSLSVVFGLLIASAHSTIIWDGRVNKTTPLSSFDMDKFAFNNKFVRGPSNWSKTLMLGKGQLGLFDTALYQTVGVVINNDSIFTPSVNNSQIGVRRGEIVPGNANAMQLFTGVVTYHFSIQPDTQRPLNPLYQYSLVFLEMGNGDHVFTLAYGTGFKGDAMITTPAPNANNLRLQGAAGAFNNYNPPTFYEAPFTGVTNFAITIDWNAATMTTYASNGTAPLTLIQSAKSNKVSTVIDNIHFGAFKYPLGPTTDLIHTGFQEAPFSNGAIYGGIFAEVGTVTMGPAGATGALCPTQPK